MGGPRWPSWAWPLLIWSVLITTGSALNLAPVFTANMNQHTLKENTPVGSIIYTLEGKDPEGSRVRYGLSGTDLFSVDALTGAVTVEQAIDREVIALTNNEVRMSKKRQKTKVTTFVLGEADSDHSG